MPSGWAEITTKGFLRSKQKRRAHIRIDDIGNIHIEGKGDDTKMVRPGWLLA
jgi:hypothetical protein